MTGLVWAATRSYQILETGFRVQFQDPDLATATDRLFAHFGERLTKGARMANTFGVLPASATPDGKQRLYRDCHRLVASESWDPLLSRLSAEINGTALREFQPFAVHAGAVALDEKVIAFPAPTGGGKSTLTAACLLAEFAYVSDEALCLDLDTGRVIPYPKPLGLSSSSRELLGILPTAGADGAMEVVVAPDQLGARVPEGDLTLTHIVLPTQRDGPPLLEEVPRSNLVASMLELSFNNFKHPEASFKLVTSLARKCRVWRLLYDDPRAAAEVLRASLA